MIFPERVRCLLHCERSTCVLAVKLLLPSLKLNWKKKLADFLSPLVLRMTVSIRASQAQQVSRQHYWPVALFTGSKCSKERVGNLQGLRVPVARPRSFFLGNNLFFSWASSSFKTKITWAIVHCLPERQTWKVGNCICGKRKCIEWKCFAYGGVFFFETAPWWKAALGEAWWRSSPHLPLSRYC